MRITLVHAGALGDTILLLPLLRGLRLLNGGDSAHLTVVMRPAFGRLLVHLGVADTWASAEESQYSTWFGDTGSAPCPDWASCDLLLSAVSNGQDAWAGHAKAALAATTGGRLCCFSPRPPEDFADHVTAFQRQQLMAQGLRLPEVLAQEERPVGVERVRNGAGLVFHPGSGGEVKCWLRERFLKIVEWWEQERGEKPVCVLGEAELERWPREVLTRLEAQVRVWRQPDLCELADALAGAELYLGNDSGITHLAAAVGVSTVVLFGPSNVRQWRPVGRRVRVLQAGGRGEMGSLTVDEVWVSVSEER